MTLARSSKQRIIIFGFSGSGKSTIANRLGKRLGLRVVHPSSMLRELVTGKAINRKNTKGQKGFWETKQGVGLLRSRLTEKHPPDMEIDKILFQELTKGGIVMESWNMPWLWKGGALRVYLKCPRTARSERVAARSKLSRERAYSAVRMKDMTTRTLFKRIYHIDIQQDTEIFDLIVETKNKTVKEIEGDILTLLK